MTSSSHHLTPFFNPNGIAIIGASAKAGKLGFGVIDNLIKSGYTGPIYPVNPKTDHILGYQTYAHISQVPNPVELAVFIIPAGAIPAALESCGQRGIRAAVILSGGFAEAGPEGAALQMQLLEIAARYQMRLVGPNGVGVMNPHTGLNTTFIEQIPEPGEIALLSQSGAVAGAMMDWAKGQPVGLSYFASLGNAADVSETDMLLALTHDPHTRVVTLYLESIHDGPGFMAAARQISAQMPIIALKAGGTEAGARAVASHTASIGGAQQAYDAAFKQVGVLRVSSVQALFGTAMALAYQRPPAGPRVAMITNAGGPAAIAADALSRAGLRVPEPDAATRAALREALGPAAQLFNPIDMLGAASTAEFETAARILLQSTAYDAVLAILVPNTANDPVGIADGLSRAAATANKPIYACFMGDVSIRAGRRRLHQHRIPVYTFPEESAQAMAQAFRWEQMRQQPRQALLQDAVQHRAVARTLRRAAQEHTFLGEAALYPLLAQLNFPLAAWTAAYTQNEAEQFAQTHAGPFALKVLSPDILHKSDLGGVALHVPATDVPHAYWELLAQVRRRAPRAGLQGVIVQQMAAPGTEVIIGMRRDATFGPLLMFGGGGVYVEALRDVAFRIAPLAADDARAMIAETVAGRLLMHGARGQRPGDVKALAMLIEQVAALALAAPELNEFELNPVIVHPAGSGLTVVDARAVF
jgi:acetyltransferase